MRVEPLRHEIASYRANGFVLIPHFFDDDELADWRRLADAEVAKAPPTSRALTGSGGYSIRATGLAARDPEWRARLHDARLARFAALLHGVDSVRYAGDAVSYQEPHCPATPFFSWWHETDWPSDTRDQFTVQILLDDNTVQNKAMLFLPGTHRTVPDHPGPRPPRTAAPGNVMDEGFRATPEWRALDPVAAEGPAGSALFYSVITAHGSGSNMTRATRRYVRAAWLPADARWNGTLGGGITNLDAAMVEGLQPGDVLDIPAMPVVWSAPGS